MKIDIVKDEKAAIGNYKPVLVSGDNIDFFNISDAECEEVRAINIMDTFSTQNLHKNFTSILKKVRLGGKLVVSGIDCNILSRQLVSSQIDESAFSNVVSECNSMSSLRVMASAIKSSGFTIESQKISGTFYEIVAKRG